MPPRRDSKSRPGGGLDSDLRRELLGLVDRSSRNGGHLDAQLRELAKSYQVPVYTEFIQQLTSLQLSPEDGAGSWQEIVAHQFNMEQRLGKAVDVRVAMLDWFLESRALKEPRIVELAAFEELEASVHRDGLTDLHNFRFFDEHLRREVAKASRHLKPLSLVMIDIDEFKSFNDRFGHEAGNQALIAVAKVLSRSLRQDDVCARYGGEEFAMVLSDTPKPAAQDVAERTRSEVQATCSGIAGVPSHEVTTISLGVATYPADASDAGALVANADKALYAAKAGGRNQVSVFGDVTRSYRRADVRLEGRFRTLEEVFEPFDTSSVGQGGFCIRVGRELPPGSLLEVRLPLPDRQGELTVAGRVVYQRRSSRGDYEVGINITEIEARDREALGQLLEAADGSPVAVTPTDD